MTTEGNGTGPASAEASGAAPASPPKEGGDTGGIGVVLYKLALAGVGALLLAQEELETAWKKRAAGDGADGAGKPELKPTVEAAAAAAAAVETKAQIDGTIARALRTLSIPTRADVEGIDARLDAIARRMDALGL